jgi:hypothetical protein
MARDHLPHLTRARLPEPAGSRGQATVEFLAVLVVALALGAVLFLSVNARVEELRAERLRAGGDELARRVANTLTLAGGSRGSSVELVIPNQVGAEPVTLTVAAQNVVVDVAGITSSRAYRAYQTRNATSGTPFNLAAGTYRVVNQNGTVSVT